MHESFLQFLWNYQLFDKTDLRTQEGESLQIIRAGTLNADAGPDFSEARLLINGVEWAGQVELHLRTSDWLLHKHQANRAYDAVILHVVWQHDATVMRTDGTPIPTLALDCRTDTRLLHKYQYLLHNAQAIPCQAQFGQVPSLYVRQALDSAVDRRLRRKAAAVLDLLRGNRGDWEETTYQMLAQTMGTKVNAGPFLRLARALPLKLLRKHGNSLLQMEALLFGQAGLLEATFTDPYPNALQREYGFMRHKYGLEASRVNAVAWKWARLRPANFPEVRIAQLAALLFERKSLFSAFLEVGQTPDLPDTFRITPSAYWQTHYQFDKPSAKSQSSFGAAGQENLLINGVAPLLTAYAYEKDEMGFYQEAIGLLERLPAEENRITRDWQALGLPVANAFDSQGSIELFNHCCSENQCLHCPVGFYLLKNAPVELVQPR
jgi:hypothetical protein